MNESSAGHPYNLIRVKARVVSPEVGKNQEQKPQDSDHRTAGQEVRVGFLVGLGQGIEWIVGQYGPDCGQLHWSMCPLLSPSTGYR